MGTEKPFDDSAILEGADKFKDERMDAFLSLDERQLVWESVAAQLGFKWQIMEREEKDRIVKRETRNIINEVMTMAGGIWGQISTEQKRELFRARFIDKNVPADERQGVFEGTAPKREEFIDMDNWFLKNRQMMEGMNLAERTAAYKMARAKWEKLQKK